MVFSFVRPFAGLEKPSQDNAEYINCEIAIWPSLITRRATLLGITMNSTLGAENRFKANFKQPIELNQNSSTFGLVIDVGESVNCLVDPPEFGASLRQFRWPITGRPPCRRFSEKNPELL
jgi:hypothetical protein